MDAVNVPVKCFHCGDECKEEMLNISNKHFCCLGCKTVYEILDENGLCDYYHLNTNPGIQQNSKSDPSRFEFLDEPQNIRSYIEFTDGTRTNVLFAIPQIHCSSCVYLLENLYKVHRGILRSQVNFSKKQVLIVFDQTKISLRQLVELLVKIGYEPNLNLERKDNKTISASQKEYYYKLGVAFFCFGNIMLLSFPEYFGFELEVDHSYQKLFSVLNLILSLPLVFYSASSFFSSAITGLKHNDLNIDVPIALGITVMFLRSVFDITFGLGPGYMDTLAGLVFLMLVGRLFQQKTYDAINFERSYKSFFPISVKVMGPEGRFYNRSIEAVKVGDRIKVNNGELVPADSILFNGKAHIDYSFVTGESDLLDVGVGEVIYAGGKQSGGSLELEVIKEVSQSYLTELWNNPAFDFSKNRFGTSSFVNIVSKYFTLTILVIAIGAGLYWLKSDWMKALNVFTSVLIITCPCALALSLPFTMGNAIRLLNRKKIFVKNSNVLENLAEISAVVFDKTGTLTSSKLNTVTYKGEALTPKEQTMVRSLLAASSHPLSQSIYKQLNAAIVQADSYRELDGRGIIGKLGDNMLRIGSAKFINVKNDPDPPFGSRVYVEINDKVKGFYSISNHYRDAFQETLKELSKGKQLFLLSGDNEGQKEFLSRVFPKNAKLMFDQTPSDKLSYINKQKQAGEKVAMIGDGLNDAGALKVSNVGIAISEETSFFTPACDIIVHSSSFSLLPALFEYARKCKRVIIVSYVLSFAYNIIGIYYAIQGLLSPLLAAVLMPLSSITIISFTTLLSRLLGRRFK